MCGVFGIRAPGRDVARLAYFGLFALQHRGQESAGIAVSEGGRQTTVRDLGLVAQVFDEQSLSALRGELAIGHNRYSTTGANAWANAQPIVHHGRARTVALGHNGNLVNAEALRAELGKPLGSTSDSEVIAVLIADDERPLDEALAAAMARLEGAATVVGLTDGALFAFRDPHGFRPLALGWLGDDPVVASESCALELVGARFERELRPGELLIADDQRNAHDSGGPGGRARLALHLRVLLPRPARHAARRRRDPRGARADGRAAGGGGARRGRSRAADPRLGHARRRSASPARAGIPFSEGLIKNRYVGRTFIQPEQGMREQGIRMKFNPLDEVAGKRLVVVDDSIVRGSTTRQIVQMLFDAGAAEVHVRISSPPVIGPCFYGIDLASENELIAANAEVEDVRAAIGATSLAYISLDGLQAATQRPETRALPRLSDRRLPDGRSRPTARKHRFEPARA